MQRTVVAFGLALLTAALGGGRISIGQPPPPPAAYVAFRFDAERLIASVRVVDVPGFRQVTNGLSPAPVAKLGYRFFALPESWQAWLPAGAGSTDRWVVQAAAGQVFEAVPERVVGGQPGCSEAIGVLLRVSPGDAAAFRALPARYFVAGPPGSRTGARATDAWVPRQLAAVRWTPDVWRAVEAHADRLLARELPGVRADAAPHVSPMASSTAADWRSWARERERLDEALALGQARLTYDMQAFRLDPSATPVYFVRAVWLVGTRQAFAASMWMRSGPQLEIVQADVRPASWLRMPEFQGRIAREHVGLVLNVLDVDDDGWGEVLVARRGYESTTIQLFEYSLSGFEPTDIQFGYGC